MGCEPLSQHGVFPTEIGAKSSFPVIGDTVLMSRRGNDNAFPASVDDQHTIHLLSIL